MPKKYPLTLEQQLFIKDNYKLFTHQVLADKLVVPVTIIRNYCSKNKLHKSRTKDKNPEPKKIISYNPPVKAKHVPPPATYSIGWEATIDKYLKK